MSAPDFSALPRGSWIAYEKSAAVQLGQVAKAGARAIALESGEKIPHRRVWLAHLAAPAADLAEQIGNCKSALGIQQLWQKAAGQTLTLPALARAAAGDDAPACQLAVLQQVLAHPIYFRRQHPRITAVAADIVARALESVQRRQRAQEEEEEAQRQLAAGGLPDIIRSNAAQLLYERDKNAPGYRLLKKHLGGDGSAFARFFIQQRLLADELDYLNALFRHQWPAMPDDTATATDTAPPPELPPVAAATLSIDDAGTVETDDAFSIAELPDGSWRVGIHVAAPALALSESEDRIARARLTSVYFPHARHFMLPPAAIARHSLTLGAPRAAVSLYLIVEMASGRWRVSHSAVENLTLTHSATPAEADSGALPPDAAAMAEKLRAAADLLAGDMAGGSARAHAPPDYKIDAAQMRITPRPRSGSSRMVEVFMRTANTVWARQLAERGSGGLFRRNGELARQPPAPPYMWLTSPLRRYVDMANQRLLLAHLRGQPAPPQHWHRLQRHFSRQHALARRFQHSMESYWALRVLQREAPAVVESDYLGGGSVRLRGYPLTAQLNGGALPDGLAAGAPLPVAIGDIDLLQQRLSVRAA